MVIMVTEQEALQLAINHAFDNASSLQYLPDGIGFDYYTGQFNEMTILPDGQYYSEDSGGEYYSFIVGINDQYYKELAVAQIQITIDSWSQLLTADGVPQEEIEEAQQIIEEKQQEQQDILNSDWSEYDVPYPFEALYEIVVRVEDGQTFVLQPLIQTSNTDTNNQEQNTDTNNQEQNVDAKSHKTLIAVGLGVGLLYLMSRK
tara:strand:+ start:1586 stop:2194 length:609 start_codon:yes stop_codon:yes gene_type:complete